MNPFPNRAGVMPRTVPDWPRTYCNPDEIESHQLRHTASSICPEHGHKVTRNMMFKKQLYLKEIYIQCLGFEVFTAVTRKNAVVNPHGATSQMTAFFIFSVVLCEPFGAFR
jgi:hypothetical protein